MNVADINFVETDTDQIKTNIITIHESLTGRTLAQGDPVRLFLETIASVIAQQKAAINFTGKMNLLAYSKDGYLDHLGLLVGANRLPASAAEATAKIMLSEAQESAIVIPAGIRITAGDNIFFATKEQIIITPGKIEGEVIVACTIAGAVGNGYLPGQLKTIVDPIPYVQSITNMTKSKGGADIEDDERYRTKIHEAPESFSTAGPDGSYEYWAKTATSLIVDVKVDSPEPGVVEVISLLEGGEIPTDEIISSIDKICNSKKIRPLTDNVRILKPEVVNFNINVTYYLESVNATELIAIKAAVETAVNDYILWQKSKLGRDINPSELVRKMVNAGAKRVDVTEPLYSVVNKKQVAVANQSIIVFGGVDND